MSKERHPNIQAVALTIDMLQSLRTNLRGAAAANNKEAFELLTPLIIHFVTEVSIKLDKQFGVGDATQYTSHYQQQTANPSSLSKPHENTRYKPDPSFHGKPSEGSGFKAHLTEKLQKVLVRLLLSRS